mgnify:CR=1 FL=1
MLACLFFSLPLAASLFFSPASDGGGSGAAPPSRLRVMAMGDSITAGGPEGGYRALLHGLLVEDGLDVEFVGARSVPGDESPARLHWAQHGWQISTVPGEVSGRRYVSIQGQNRNGLLEELDAAISPEFLAPREGSRDVVLLMIGMNDVLHQVVDEEHGRFDSDEGRDGMGESQEWIGKGCIARLEALLRAIDARAAAHGMRLEVLVATMPIPTRQWTRDALSDVMLQGAREYNAWIVGELPGLSFEAVRIGVVDMAPRLEGLLHDGVHPRAEGHAAMAKAWRDAIVGEGE